MTNAIGKVCKESQASSIKANDITEEMIEQSLYTQISGLGLQPDLLIRTSGESRLSDFLLWQTSYSITYFTSVLWPEFSLRNFIFAIFYYQRHAQYLRQLIPQFSLQSEDANNSNLQTFLKKNCWRQSCGLELCLNDYVMWLALSHTEVQLRWPK